MEASKPRDDLGRTEERVRKEWHAPQLGVSSIADKTQTQAGTFPYDLTGNLSS